MKKHTSILSIYHHHPHKYSLLTRTPTYLSKRNFKQHSFLKNLVFYNAIFNVSALLITLIGIIFRRFQLLQGSMSRRRGGWVCHVYGSISV